MSGHLSPRLLANHTSSVIHHAPIPLAILKGVAFSFNIVSILSSILLLIIFYTFRARKPLILNRVSLRLVVAIAYANILYSLAQMTTDLIPPTSLLCTLSPYLYIVLTLLTVFLTVAIAYNLHSVFVLGRENTLYREKFYYFFSILLAALVPAPALINQMFGWSPVEETCWFKDQHRTAYYFTWVFSSYYLWLVVALFYCSYVVMRVSFKLYQKRRMAEKNVEMGTSDMDAFMRKQMRQAMLKMVGRNVRYPAVPLITQSFNLIHDVVLWTTGKSVYVLMFASYVGTALQGLLTFIVFALDPAVQRAYESIRKDAVLDYLHEQDMWDEKQVLKQPITSKDKGGIVTQTKRWLVMGLWVTDQDRVTWLQEKMLQSTESQQQTWTVTGEKNCLKSYGSSGSSSFGSSDDEDMEDHGNFNHHAHDEDAEPLVMPTPVVKLESSASSMSSVDMEVNLTISVPPPAFLATGDTAFERALTPDIYSRSFDMASMDSLDRVAASGAASVKKSQGARSRVSLGSLQHDTLERLKQEEENKEGVEYWSEMSAL